MATASEDAGAEVSCFERMDQTQMNMTEKRRQTLLELCGTQLERITLDDAEWICEQWWSEIEYPYHTHRPTPDNLTKRNK